MKYRKIPVVIEAEQYFRETVDKVFEFVEERTRKDNERPMFIDVSGNLVIETLEGNHIANEGDYIICGVAGEFYPCKPAIFEKTYEKVE